MTNTNEQKTYGQIVCNSEPFSYNGKSFTVQDLLRPPYFDDSLEQYEFAVVAKCVETGSLETLRLACRPDGVLLDLKP